MIDILIMIALMIIICWLTFDHDNDDHLGGGFV